MMADEQPGVSLQAAAMRDAIGALVDQDLDGGTDPREVFHGVALAFGKALSELVSPDAAAWFMQREATRVAALASPSASGGVQ